MATNTLNKENIINNNHYGLQIYAHILQEAFPADSTVIRLEGRECGLCRNPFSSGSRTLHIPIHKQDPANQLSPEMAMHKDISRNIPDGNSLHFAENYYHLQGKALLQHPNPNHRNHHRKRSKHSQVVAERADVGGRSFYMCICLKIKSSFMIIFVCKLLIFIINDCYE